MKTAIYIEDGVMQLVLTPESDFEKQCLGTFHKQEFETKFFDGSFYDCRGGWVRQNPYYDRGCYSIDNSRDHSLILVSKGKQED